METLYSGQASRKLEKLIEILTLKVFTQKNLKHDKGTKNDIFARPQCVFAKENIKNDKEMVKN